MRCEHITTAAPVRAPVRKRSGRCANVVAFAQQAPPASVTEVSRRHLMYAVASLLPFYQNGTAQAMVPTMELGPAGFKLTELVAAEDVAAALSTVRSLSSVLEQYSYLAFLKADNPGLFYTALVRNPEELLPIVYTPGVGDACLNWGNLKTRPVGLRLTLADAGSLAGRMRQWSNGAEVQTIVVTDGQRILGLGDLGANGMGIPVGKSLLYSVAGGLHPRRLLPVVLDVGCDDEAFREGPAYVGLRQPRATGEEYDSFVDEFHSACREVYGGDVLIHWEDFGSQNASRLLERYQSLGPTFNDDIQSTAAVALATVLSACRGATVPDLAEQTFMFVGAGQASLGIAELAVKALLSAGLSEGEALARIWMLDRTGLLLEGRESMSPAKARFSQSSQAARSARVTPRTTLVDAVKAVKPTCLIGAAGKGGLFTQAILKSMSVRMPASSNGTSANAAGRATPVILALSNPTALSECTFQEAVDATGGDVVFAAGSPFPTAQSARGDMVCSQANNAMIYPGLGAGVVLSGASSVPESCFLAAAEALAEEVTDEERKTGLVLPPVARIRDAALTVATAVCMQCASDMVSTNEGNKDVLRAAAAVLAGRDASREQSPGTAKLADAIEQWRF